MDMRSIYLDHAATTPLDPWVRERMQPYLEHDFGNPSSAHRLGQRARMAIDESRERIASVIGADPSEIVFTSGGTESDNLAIRGVAVAHAGRGNHIVTTSIEHEAVLETCADLVRHHGFKVERVDPDTEGLVDMRSIAGALQPETVLVSVMYANNEIGTIQPIREIGELCRRRGILFHVDAVQAAAISIDVERDNIDLMSLSAHKLYGPKGVGVLYIRRGVRWWPQQLGGGQERMRRSGTENVPGIVGMAAALDISVQRMSEAARRLAEMRDFLFDEIRTAIPSTIVNGSRVNRLPTNVNLSFPGIGGEALVTALDARGLMASSGSACSSGSTEPSHVLLRIGRSPTIAEGALRLSLGRENTWDEIREAARLVVDTVHRLQMCAKDREPVIAEAS